MKVHSSVRERPFPRPTLGTDEKASNLDSLFGPSVRKPGADREAAILWVRMQIARHGITFENLVEAGCFLDNGESAANAVLYRSADGQTWNGRGELPDWLQRAVNAGQSIEFFKVG